MAAPEMTAIRAVRAKFGFLMVHAYSQHRPERQVKLAGICPGVPLGIIRRAAPASTSLLMTASTAVGETHDRTQKTSRPARSGTHAGGMRHDRRRRGADADGLRQQANFRDRTGTAGIGRI